MPFEYRRATPYIRWTELIQPFDVSSARALARSKLGQLILTYPKCRCGTVREECALPRSALRSDVFRPKHQVLIIDLASGFDLVSTAWADESKTHRGSPRHSESNQPDSIPEPINLFRRNTEFLIRCFDDCGWGTVIRRTHVCLTQCFS